jgi:hypothetical protein
LFAVGIEAIAGDDAGNVGTVTVVVVRLGPAVYEVFEVGDPLIPIRIVERRGWADREIVMKRGDARVDDCYTNPRTRETHQAAHEKVATRDRRPEVVCKDGTVVADAGYVAVARHAVQQGVRHVENDAVDKMKSVAPGEAPELGRQLAAGVQRDDNARGLRCRSRLTPPNELAVELPGRRSRTRVCGRRSERDEGK